MLVLIIIIKIVFVYQIWMFYRGLKRSAGKLTLLADANQKSRCVLLVSYCAIVILGMSIFFGKDIKLNNVAPKEHTEESSFFK